jgi:hypothetical protein
MDSKKRKREKACSKLRSRTRRGVSSSAETSGGISREMSAFHN